MAKWTPTEFNGQPARLYEDGSIRNERGQALALPPKMREHAITSDNAHEMIRLREEKRRRLYAEGAQMAVADIRLIEKYGEDAHIVERARTLQEIASTPDAGKAAVMADASLRKAQGLEDTADGVQASVLDGVGYILREVAQFAREIVSDNSNYRKHEVIDGQTDDGMDAGAEAELPADVDDGDG